MSREKSPYKKFTIEEVERVENGNFYIQIGSDIFVSETGKMVFSKEKSEKFYFQLWEALDHMKKTGNKQEVLDAYTCLSNLKMFPLRIH